MSTVTIETIRILEGTQQIVEVDVGEELGDQAIEVKIKIPSIVAPEEEHRLNLGIWYRYQQGEQEKSGSFQKSLGKVTLINPG